MTDDATRDENQTVCLYLSFSYLLTLISRVRSVFYILFFKSDLLVVRFGPLVGFFKFQTMNDYEEF